MASGIANTDDGASWETVLRFLKTPTPADYSFGFEFDARSVYIIIRRHGRHSDDNLRNILTNVATCTVLV